MRKPPKIPADLESDPAAAYARGWHDRSNVASRRGGEARAGKLSARRRREIAAAGGRARHAKAVRK